MFQKTQTNCIFMSPNFAIHRPLNEFWYFWCFDITETGIHRSSVSRIICKDLRLKCFKRHHPQKLTDANCTTRIKRANLKLLLQNNFPEFWHWLCLGRKVFSIASPDNRQNDLVYAPHWYVERTLHRAISFTGHMFYIINNFQKCCLSRITGSVCWLKAVTFDGGQNMRAEARQR